MAISLSFFEPILSTLTRFGEISFSVNFHDIKINAEGDTNDEGEESKAFIFIDL
jgi:hypothetical protein